MTTATLCKPGIYDISDPVWFPKSYRCHLAIIKDGEGSFSAVVMNLPGAGSCGDTEEEAIANVREAVVGLIESYGDHQQEIPWSAFDSYEIPEGAGQKWILVDA